MRAMPLKPSCSESVTSTSMMRASTSTWGRGMSSWSITWESVEKPSWLAWMTREFVGGSAVTVTPSASSVMAARSAAGAPPGCPAAPAVSAATGCPEMRDWSVSASSSESAFFR